MTNTQVSAQQEAKDTAVVAVDALDWGAWRGGIDPSTEEIVNAVFPIIWRARGDADRAAVESGPVETTSLDASRAIAALGEER